VIRMKERILGADSMGENVGIWYDW
jgi:hypothetical protein